MVRWRWLGVLMLSCMLVEAVPHKRLLSEELMNDVQIEFGIKAYERMDSWQNLYQKSLDLSEKDQLKKVNVFFNQLRFLSDQEHWGLEDYWASPVEMLGTNGGDCEDFVIAKYFTLQSLGVNVEKLRITYVKAIRLNQAHMVLTYFSTPEGIPLVLDNLTTRIIPANKRPDLVPVYSFNGQGMWLDRMKGRGVRMGDPNKLDLWTNLRLRMKKQGLEL